MTELTAKDQADLAAMHAEPGTRETWGSVDVRELDALPVRTRVADATGDLWAKQPDGTWAYQRGMDSAELTSEALLHVWGPLNLIPERGI